MCSTSGGKAPVRLTPELLHLAQHEQAPGLTAELHARWSIVESSFSAGVGRALIQEGLTVDWPTLTLTDKRRRRPVTGVAQALIGFQHGRCLICHETLELNDAVAVDHVFPYALMRRYASVRGWAGPDLDALWNLAPAHQAVMGSPHPLRKTLELTLNSKRRVAGGGSWVAFLHEVQKECA
ncbi:hypothetical protein SSPIM334S_07948 [Streptomyces spiroverticillatus]